MCLPELQKPSEESSVSDVDVVVEEQSDEDNQSVSDNESSSDTSIGNE
jgi:hypothetical protein